MKKKALDLPEIIIGTSEIRNQITRWQKEKRIRNIAPRLYTSNFEEKPEEIIKRNIYAVLGGLYPGALLSHRSAFEFRPTSSGNIFVTYDYTKKVKLPGVTIRLLEGKGPIEGDNKYSGELYVSQKERALLENLQISKKPGPESKTLSLPLIEERLEEIIRVHGEKGLNEVRDKARSLSKKLNMQKEFERLNKLISALLATGSIKNLQSPIAIARASNIPFDKARINLFEKLFIELKNREFKIRPDKNKTLKAFRNFAFFESYFSNYIEGTVFELEEAKKIVETGRPLPARNEDSHDILGTYQLVSNKNEMSVISSKPQEFLDILLRRHKVLLSARKSMTPGKFKEKNNKAGNTYFVDYTEVRGTLIKAFDFYQALTDPFSRAAFMMFLITEVHPFQDGNGRIARVMMNAEFVKADQSRIIIPTVYREDYLGGLRKLSRQGEPAVYLRMLERAHEFSANIYGNNMDEMQKYLEHCNAFEEEEGIILKIQPRV